MLTYITLCLFTPSFTLLGLHSSLPSLPSHFSPSLSSFLVSCFFLLPLFPSWTSIHRFLHLHFLFPILIILHSRFFIFFLLLLSLPFLFALMLTGLLSFLLTLLFIYLLYFYLLNYLFLSSCLLICLCLPLYLPSCSFIHRHIYLFTLTCYLFLFIIPIYLISIVFTYFTLMLSSHFAFPFVSLPDLLHSSLSSSVSPVFCRLYLYFLSFIPFLS